MKKVTKFESYLLENFDTDLEEARDFEKLLIVGTWLLIVVVLLTVL